MVVITCCRTRDVRFALPPGDGTDSVHSIDGSITYGYAVCELRTDSPHFQGDGLGFTLGGGTELVCAAIEQLAEPLLGREIEQLMAGWGDAFKQLADHPTLRWLGPHSGVTHLALASISNAVFDLWAKARGQPLWQLLLSLSPERLVALLDLSYCEDAVTPAEALAMLSGQMDARAQREEAVLSSGIPGYDTSAGWMDCTDAEIEERSKAAVAGGFRAVKLKVGGLQPGSEQRDLDRLALVRRAVGEDIQIAVDANQQWTLPQAQQICPKLCAVVRPLFIEEPTHPADIAAHVALAKAVAPVPLAAGEAIPNRVMFKQFMMSGAIGVAQIDPTRLGGVSEALVCALMAKKYGIRVIPHVGDMGQISQHLLLVYHVALGIELEFLEYIPHLRDYFRFPATVQAGRYVPPSAPGASTSIVSRAEAEQAMRAGAATKFIEASGSAEGRKRPHHD